MRMANKVFILFIFLFYSCLSQPDKPKEKYIIGFSQCTTGDDWRMTMNEEMQREISLKRGYDIELIIKDAADDNEKQMNDIRELVDLGIDLLIVSPNEAEPLTPVVEEVYDKDIPVIVIDRMINSPKFTSYIGADNFIIGREAGNYAVELLKGKGKIVEISGLRGSTPAIERSNGFREAISQYPDISIVKTVPGDWLLEKSLEITDSLLSSYRSVDLIFAHNDPMAYGAYLTTKKYKLDPFIIGIDGLNKNGGVQYVLDGLIDGTFLYPTGGDKAIQLAIDILEGAAFQKYNYLNTIRIDNSNARITMLQGEQIEDQQSKIDNLDTLLIEMSNMLRRKNTFLLLTICLIILIVFTGALIFYMMLHKTRINRELDNKHKIITSQNKKITDQRDHLVKMLKITEETKETKLQVLTNIYHEFKNVLTLINQPIEELSESNFDESLKEKLNVVRKGSRRLLRLSEEIMDFTRLDNAKVNIVFARVDISRAVSEIAEVFKEKAHEKSITIIKDLQEKVFAECDISVIEKILYNLLINAINYTGKGGRIFVMLKDEDRNISMTVKDTGTGISEEELPNLFTRSHRLVNNSKRTNGESYGIGLAFSKQLVQLHGGQIEVSSKINEGASFKVILPKLHSHSQKRSVDKEVEEEQFDEIILNASNKDNTVLIVEDNPEMRIIVSKIIEKYYNVLIAPNGEKGYELAKNHTPDIVVSDVLMPVMDGIEMCTKLKKNALTSHIPVIMLTALDSMESNIKGLEVGADGYITKPFSETLLIQTINNLLKSRDRIKEVFGFSGFIDTFAKTKDRQDQIFIKKCIEVIFNNIEDETFHIDGLAELLNTSRSSLYKKIKEITGLKAVDFVKKAKLQYAAKLLINNNFNINEIAWKSGFSDVKYFSKCFSEQYKCNPTVFRNKVRNN